MPAKHNKSIYYVLKYIFNHLFLYSTMNSCTELKYSRKGRYIKSGTLDNIFIKRTTLRLFLHSFSTIHL